MVLRQGRPLRLLQQPPRPAGGGGGRAFAAPSRAGPSRPLPTPFYRFRHARPARHAARRSTRSGRAVLTDSRLCPMSLARGGDPGGSPHQAVFLNSVGRPVGSPTLSAAVLGAVPGPPPGPATLKPRSLSTTPRRAGRPGADGPAPSAPHGLARAQLAWASLILYAAFPRLTAAWKRKEETLSPQPPRPFVGPRGVMLRPAESAVAAPPWGRVSSGRVIRFDRCSSLLAPADGGGLAFAAPSRAGPCRPFSPSFCHGGAPARCSGRLFDAHC